MPKAFKIIRSLLLCVFILAGSGCLYNVHELMDHSICERSKDVIDLEPLTHFEKKRMLLNRVQKLSLTNQNQLIIKLMRA